MIGRREGGAARQDRASRCREHRFVLSFRAARSFMAKLDGIDLAKFRKAFEWSRKQLAPFRQRRSAIIRLLAGSRYGYDNLSQSQPVPFLHLLHSVYTRSLVASNPRCLLSTKVPQLKPVAHAMEIAVNHEIREMRLAESLRQVVSDALISIGILKVGICTYPMEGAEGLIHDYQKTYADSISLDDWNHDMRARRVDQWGYAGHRFRVPRRALAQDPRYDPAVVQKLSASDRYVYDEWGNIRSESISTDRSTTSEGDHEDMLDLWEVWFPRDQAIAVFAADQTGRLKTIDPLYVTDYDGPELGPYHLLRFGEIPDNIMPAPPILDMADMHEAMNGVYRKLIREGLRFKSLMMVPGGSDEDAKRINDAADGMAVRIDTMPPQEARYGGADQALQQFFIGMKQAASYFAGNFDSWAGQGVTAPTLGQERLVADSSSKQIQGMQESTISYTRDVMSSLAWYWWTDAKRDYQVEVPVNGHPGQSVPVNITAEDREGLWLKLNFQIDPYSLQDQGPQAKLQVIMQMVQQVMPPLMPFMQQQQMGVNVAALFQQFARYTNMTDLTDIIMAAQPIGAEQEQNEVPKMPAQTTRSYERVSRPASTAQSQDMTMMQALGGTANGQQQNAMGRTPE